MNFFRTTVIDCGSSRTALGQFRKQEDGRLRLETFTLEKFAIKPASDAAWLENTAAAMRALRKRLRRDATAILVLPPHLVLLRSVKTPPAAGPGQREQIVRFEAEQLLPGGLDSLVWGWVESDEPGGGGLTLLCAARLALVEALCASAEAAGFRPRSVLPAALTTLAGVRLLDSSAASPSLLLNVGARSTMLLHTEGNRFQARALALGGDDVAKQLTDSLGCSYAAAEAHKHSEPFRPMVEFATEALVVRLAQEIARTLQHFGGQVEMGAPKRFVMTGGSVPLPGFGGRLGAKLRLPVDRPGLVGGPIRVAAAAADAGAVQHGPALCDMVGAAALELLAGRTAIDLLPPSRQQRAVLRRRLPWLAAAAVLAFASIGMPAMHYRALGVAARDEAAALERELQPLRERDARIRSNRAQLEHLSRQIAVLQSIGKQRGAWPAMLGDLQRRLAMVEDVWLERLEILPPPASPADPMHAYPADDYAPLCIAISGRMPGNAGLQPGSDSEPGERMKQLLDSITGSRHFGQVVTKRIDSSQPGVLRFDLVLVPGPEGVF